MTLKYCSFIILGIQRVSRSLSLLQVCGKAFDFQSELMSHGKCHLGGSMYTCSVCFHVFANEESLTRHSKRHSIDRPYCCTICMKTFARKEHLENHTRCHTGEICYLKKFHRIIRYSLVELKSVGLIKTHTMNTPVQQLFL